GNKSMGQSKTEAEAKAEAKAKAEAVVEVLSPPTPLPHAGEGLVRSWLMRLGCRPACSCRM
ncbi:MAG: hypothetical protein ACN6Q8_00335, partial [Stenotrophomonas sp.]